MPTSIRSEANRSVIVINGADKLAINEDGSMELLAPAANPTGNDVPTAGQLPAITLVSATAKSASGTAVDFTGIPSWAKRVTIVFSDISTTGTSPFQIQIGSVSGIETSGYAGGYNFTNASVSSGNTTSGLKFQPAQAAAVGSFVGSAALIKISGNSWVLHGEVYRQDVSGSCRSLCTKTLSGILYSIRLTTENGTDTFDAGSVNIMWE